MRFDLSPRLFDIAVDDHLRREIVAFAYEGRHVIAVIEDARDAWEQWRQEQPRGVQDELEIAVRASAEEEALAPHLVRVVVQGVEADDWSADPPRLSAQSARNLGRQATRIFVEDIESDQSFVRAVAPQGFREQLDDLLQRGWAEFIHGGGSGLNRVLQDAARSVSRFRRAIVVYDSDAREPGRPSAAALELGRLCDRLGVAHHRLERRESENYLPPQALNRWAVSNWRDRRQRMRAWMRLTPEQRHHFDMKNGFGDGEPPAVYAGMSDADREVPRRGFGRDIWHEFHDLEPAWLDRDGQRQELLRLYATIQSLR